MAGSGLGFGQPHQKKIGHIPADTYMLFALMRRSAAHPETQLIFLFLTTCRPSKFWKRSYSQFAQSLDASLSKRRQNQAEKLPKGVRTPIMDITRLVLAWSWPVIGAAGAWLMLEFATKPYLRFRELRAMVHARLLTLETAILIPLAMHNPNRAVMIEAHNATIQREVQALREAGIALATMADTEWLLNKLLTAFGYDIHTAGVGLMSLPVMLRNRPLTSLSPPFDDEIEKFLTVLRKTLGLPERNSIEANSE